MNNDRLLRTFFELVQVDSETGEERAICDLLKAKFITLGCQVFEDDTTEITGHGAGNLFVHIAATPGCEAAPKLLFTCHMDTVKPGNEIKPRLDDDGYLRSDGTTILASDDKAGIAALLEALLQIEEQQMAHGDIQLVITVGEESGLVGAKAVDPALLIADFGYAFDANGPVGEIIVAGPAQAKILAVIHGRAAHAGVNPEDGISAIQVASRAVSRMSLGRIDSETTANIGRFSGGGETNIVCDRIELFAEARSHSQVKLDKQLKAMENVLAETATEYGATSEFHAEIVYPGFAYDEHHRVVQIAKQAASRIGRSPVLVKSGGGSDANIFNGHGIPTLNLAIGYEHIHTTKEQLLFAELIKTTELVLAIVEEAAEQ
jgi:tripeptide aminopeptidase